MKLNDIPAPVWYGAFALVGGLILLRLARSGAAAAAQAVNPLNRDNIFAASVNAAGAALSEDESFSLGAWIYDITHPDEQRRARTREAAVDALGG